MVIEAREKYADKTTPIRLLSDPSPLSHSSQSYHFALNTDSEFWSDYWHCLTRSAYCEESWLDSDFFIFFFSTTKNQHIISVSYLFPTFGNLNWTSYRVYHKDRFKITFSVLVTKMFHSGALPQRTRNERASRLRPVCKPDPSNIDWDDMRL